jgi:hypothetical protein
MSYVLGQVSFDTKQAVTQACRDILHATPQGKAITSTEQVFLLDLFQHHTEWLEKRGPGVSAITTMVTWHGTKCFVLHRVDGSQVDISFAHAIKHLPPSAKRDLKPQRLLDFKMGARAAIKDQIDAFIASQPPELYSPHAWHVDHVPPLTFDQLLFNFCQEQGISPERVTVSEQPGCVPRIDDDAILQAWSIYHQEHAQLRLLPKTENLRLPKSRLDWSVLRISNNS